VNQPGVDVFVEQCRRIIANSTSGRTARAGWAAAAPARSVATDPGYTSGFYM
jgi:hypothetical protein